VGKVVDQHAVEGVGGAVIGIGKAEVTGYKGIGRIFEDRDSVVCPCRRIVHRSDIEGECVRRGIQIRSAVGGSAVIFDLKSETGVRVAITIERWSEVEVGVCWQAG